MMYINPTTPICMFAHHYLSLYAPPFVQSQSLPPPPSPPSLTFSTFGFVFNAFQFYDTLFSLMLFWVTTLCFHHRLFFSTLPPLPSPPINPKHLPPPFPPPPNKPSLAHRIQEEVPLSSTHTCRIIQYVG